MITNRKSGDETILTASRTQGIHFAELYELMGRLIAVDPNILKAPVCLCLDGIESSTTIITEATNEGDMQTFWLKLTKSFEKEILDGIT
jgi:hypothetical protein